MFHSRLRPMSRRPRPPLPLNPITATTENETEPPPDSVEDPEDLFTSFLPHLFPDDAPSFHGDPGQALLYSHGLPHLERGRELEIMVPGYPSTEASASKSKESDKGEEVESTEDGWRLFAHFLWSAALVVAEGVEGAAMLEAEMERDGAFPEEWNTRRMSGDLRWSVKGEHVLELGAGAALPSIISALAGASSVAITDHPSSTALGPDGAIRENITRNVPESLHGRVSVHPHEWGILESSTFARENQGFFTRIIVADCLWMRSQHKNLVRTLLWFLRKSTGIGDDGTREAEEGGKIWVVAGFHTGREIVASFFETAIQMGLVIEEIWERDVNAAPGEDGEIVEVKREWMPFREEEGPNERKRWSAIAVLREA